MNKMLRMIKNHQVDENVFKNPYALGYERTQTLDIRKNLHKLAISVVRIETANLTPYAWSVMCDNDC